MRIKDFAATARSTVDFIVEDQDRNLVWGVYPDADMAVSKDNYHLEQLEGDIVDWHLTIDGCIWVRVILDRYTPAQMPEISNMREVFEEFIEDCEQLGIGCLL